MLMAALTLLLPLSATASTLTFTGNNAALFSTAPPLNNALMMQTVRRPANPSTSGGSSGLTPADLILQSVTSQISAKIRSDIFDGGAASGSYDLGGGSLIDFIRVGGNIIITLTDPRTGVTTITVPDI